MEQDENYVMTADYMNSLSLRAIVPNDMMVKREGVSSQRRVSHRTRDQSSHQNIVNNRSKKLLTHVYRDREVCDSL